MTISVQLIQIPASETVPHREFFLNGTVFKIGRDFAADVCLPDLSGQISRTHSVLKKTPTGSYKITNTSTNGTALNGKDMASKETLPVADGDIISLGDYRLLIGIVGRPLPVAAETSDAEIVFETESDFSSENALMPDEAMEEVVEFRDDKFSKTEVDLDPDLMFDPFAEGPGLDESSADSVPDMGAATSQLSDATNQTGVSNMLDVILPHDAGMPTRHQSPMHSVLYRDQVLAAMELAFESFLSELDPEKLQSDYDDYIPMLANRPKRYWKIYMSQFAKKRANGEFRRNFMAIFAEEMWKK
jgi:type VI secretion system protein ImpI